MLTRYFERPRGSILVALLTLSRFLCFSLNAILCRFALLACGMDPLRREPEKPFGRETVSAQPSGIFRR